MQGTVARRGGTLVGVEVWRDIATRTGSRLWARQRWKGILRACWREGLGIETECESELERLQANNKVRMWKRVGRYVDTRKLSPNTSSVSIYLSTTVFKTHLNTETSPFPTPPSHPLHKLVVRLIPEQLSCSSRPPPRPRQSPANASLCANNPSTNRSITLPSP